MKMIIAGGRDFNDLRGLARYMRTLKRLPTEIVCGEAKGADTVGLRWARGHNVDVAGFPANWFGLGKAAGHHRNTQMAEYADALLALWDGESKGTEHMISEAERLGLYVKVIYYQKSSKATESGTITEYSYTEPCMNKSDIDS